MAVSKKKIFVLDTSVLLHDHHSIMKFEENDVVIPITVLEELDKFKVGNEIKNFEARECIRFIDKISENYTLNDWIQLKNGKRGRLRIQMQTDHALPEDATKIFESKKNDHLILNVAIELKYQFPRTKVILVSKDINLRLKAKAMHIFAEDYKHGKVNDLMVSYSGITQLDDVDANTVKKLYQSGVVAKPTAIGKDKVNNHFYILRNHQSSVLAYYNETENALLRVDKMYCCGIKPKNAEQTFAMHAIMNPNIKLITISGVAGTGKTLLALAGALEQRNQFEQILLARPIIPLSNREIGFLPGDAQEKVNPYMQPLFDNLNFIKNLYGENEKKRRWIEEMQEQGRITITPLAFIRGRSLSNCIFIIDEAQNLTPHEVKTIITRAGENTKVILTGDVRQIDTPYLDENSNGLSYVIERLKGSDLYCHITLAKGERSELANLANEKL